MFFQTVAAWKNIFVHACYDIKQHQLRIKTDICHTFTNTFFKTRSRLFAANITLSGN